MRKIIFFILFALTICGAYFIPFKSIKDCTHPITKSCIQGGFRSERVHIVGRRFWHLPVFYCRTYLVDKNSCYWEKYRNVK